MAQDHRTPTRSNMVAGGVTNDTNRNTLHATAQLLPSQRFPIHKWEPRTGYNEDYIKWKLDVDQLAHALGMDPLTLFSEQDRDTIVQRHAIKWKPATTVCRALPLAANVASGVV